MGRSMGTWTLGLLLITVTSWATSARGVEPGQDAESPQEQILKKNGLKAMGPTYVLEAEAEVKAKASQAKRLAKQWNYARIQQQATLSPKDYQAMIQGMTAQIAQFRNQLNMVNQQINRFPRYRGRIANSYAQADYQELVVTRTQLNATINMQNQQLAQFKSHPPDPKAKQKIDDEVQSKYDDYVQAVHDLNQLVTTTKEKYAALSKNSEVSKALAGLDPAIKPRPQLSPSHEFHETAKLAARLDKETSQVSAEPKTKAAARSRRGAKAAHTPGRDDSPN